MRELSRRSRASPHVWRQQPPARPTGQVASGSRADDAARQPRTARALEAHDAREAHEAHEVHVVHEARGAW